MKKKSVEIEVNDTRFVLRKWQLRNLPELFHAVTVGTPFEGSRLVFTGNTGKDEKGRRLYEFGLLPTVDSYEPIPGYRFLGYTQHVTGEHWTVHRVNPEYEFSPEVVAELDPARCDVCGHRRNRKRLFVCEEIETKKLVIVGGSCAKKFRGINLEDLVRKITSIVRTVVKDLEERYGGVKWIADLAYDVALAEFIVDRVGYVSKKAAEFGENVSTSSLLSAFYSTSKYQEDDRKFLNALIAESGDKFCSRVRELEDTEFKEFKDHFKAQQENRWSEFNNNMLAYLEGGQASWGISAYLGSVRKGIADRLARSKRTTGKVVDKGFSFSTLNKVSDLGRFRVLNTRWKEGHWGCSLAFLVASVKDGTKLWFQLGSETKACREWDRTVGERLVSEKDGFEVEIRGKVTEVKSTLSFAKNIKFQKVEQVV